MLCSWLIIGQWIKIDLEKMFHVLFKNWSCTCCILTPSDVWNVALFQWIFSLTTVLPAEGEEVALHPQAHSSNRLRWISLKEIGQHCLSLALKVDRPTLSREKRFTDTFSPSGVQHVVTANRYRRTTSTARQKLGIMALTVCPRVKYELDATTKPHVACELFVLPLKVNC